MATAWFVAPYKRRANTHRPMRYCAMDDFTPQIAADKGAWAETEVLGDCAIVKVQAQSATLDKIESEGGFYRFPVSNYNASLSSLKAADEQRLHDILEVMGYTTGEIGTALGTDFKARKLSDILKVAATRRRKPRYDARTDTIIVDGPIQFCRHPDTVEAEVQE